MSYLDNLDAEMVASLNEEDLLEAYRALKSEGVDVEPEFVPRKGDPESIGLFRDYLTDLVTEVGNQSESDADSDAGSDSSDIPYQEGPPADEVPELKCNVADFGNITKCPSNMFCDVADNMCYTNRPFTATVDGIKIGAISEEELNGWKTRLAEHKQSEIRRKEGAANKPVPPTDIPPRVLFTEKFRKAVEQASEDINKLKEFARQAGVAEVEDKDLLLSLLLSKIDANRCNLNVKSEKAFKGCPDPLICDVDTGDCMDSASANSRVETVNGMRVFGSASAVQSFLDKLKPPQNPRCNTNVSNEKDFQGCPPGLACDIDTNECVVSTGDARVETVNGMKVFGSNVAIQAFIDKVRGNAGGGSGGNPEYKGVSISDVDKEKRIGEMKKIAVKVGVTGASGYSSSQLEKLKGMIKAKIMSMSSGGAPPPKPASPPKPKSASQKPKAGSPPKPASPPRPAAGGNPEYKGVSISDVDKENRITWLKKLAVTTGVTGASGYSASQLDKLKGMIRAKILANGGAAPPPRQQTPPKPAEKSPPYVPYSPYKKSDKKSDKKPSPKKPSPVKPSAANEKLIAEITKASGITALKRIHSENKLGVPGVSKLTAADAETLRAKMIAAVRGATAYTEERCNFNVSSAEDFTGCPKGMYCQVETNLCFKEAPPGVKTATINGFDIFGSEAAIAAMKAKLNKPQPPPEAPQPPPPFNGAVPPPQPPPAAPIPPQPAQTKPKKPTAGGIRGMTGRTGRSVEQIEQRLRKCAGLVA